MAFTVGNENRDLFTRLRKMTPIKRLEEFKMQSTQGSTPFSLLTPEQFSELFPRYYRERLPDVGGFMKALSSKKELGGEGQTYGPHGNTGTATPSSNERVTNLVKAKEIYDYLRAKGVDHIHATGIINNMKYESSFNSGAMGDHDTSGGLFQHHASRFSAMKQYVGEGWQTNWKKQIDFALTESEMKTYLGRNLANAQDASIRFTQDFEKPLHTDSVAQYRAGTAGGYDSAMLGRGGEPAGGQTPGGNYEINSSGYIMPKDKRAYDPGNEQQCATLVKGLNPDVGRSSSWTVVPGEIKPGVAVATMRYNLPGGDRTGSGYHSGIAMSAPDADGNFMLLEQFNGQPPRVRQVNVKYGGGAMGGSTNFGLISSNGRLHDEQSIEALRLGAEKTGDEEMKKRILSNADAVAKGDTTGSQPGTGNVSVNQEQPAGALGPQTNLQQQQVVGNIQTATIGDMMKMVGDLAGFFTRGEGMGGAGKKHVRAAHTAVSYNPDVAPTGLNVGSGLIDYVGDMITKAVGLTQEQFNAMRQAKASIESSGGKYDLRGGSSKRFSGAYQMGGDEIVAAAKRLGIEPPVVRVKGKSKPVASEQFINDPHLQERLHEAMMMNHHEQLMRNKKYAALPPEGKADTLMIAHNAGAGGASRYLRTGQAKTDAFGTHPERYATHFRKQLKGLETVQAATPKETQTAQTTPSERRPATAMATPAPKGKFEKLFEAAKETLLPRTAPAQEKPNTYSESAARMRQMKPTPAQQPIAPAPEPTGGIEFDTPETRQKLEQETAPRDKQSFNMAPAAPAQKPITIDAFNDRAGHKLPNESLARAMQNTKDPEGANKDHNFMTSVGSFG